MKVVYLLVEVGHLDEYPGPPAAFTSWGTALESAMCRCAAKKLRVEGSSAIGLWHVFCNDADRDGPSIEEGRATWVIHETPVVSAPVGEPLCEKEPF